MSASILTRTGIATRAASLCAAVLWTILAGLAPVPAAADEAAFTVHAVPVETEAASAAEAREAAIAEAQGKALRLLLERLTVPDDHSRLPQLSPQGVQELVRGFSVDEEKTTATRYIGKVTVQFVPQQVRTLLRRAGIPYGEAVAKPALVLPVVADESTPLWPGENGPNAWYEAWSTVGPENRLVPVNVPLGDLADTGTIDKQGALDFDTQALSQLAARNGADTAMVAIARPRDGALDAELLVHGGALSGRSYSASAEVPGNDRVARVAALRELAVSLLRQAEADWTRANLLRFDQAGSVQVAAPITALADWVAIRSRLDRVASIQNRNLLSLSRNQVVLQLDYVGNINQLANALAQVDLALEQAPPGGLAQWTLKLR